MSLRQQNLQRNVERKCSFTSFISHDNSENIVHEVFDDIKNEGIKLMESVLI